MRNDAGALQWPVVFLMLVFALESVRSLMPGGMVARAAFIALMVLILGFFAARGRWMKWQAGWSDRAPLHAMFVLSLAMLGVCMLGAHVGWHFFSDGAMLVAFMGSVWASAVGLMGSRGDAGVAGDSRKEDLAGPRARVSALAVVALGGIAIAFAVGLQVGAAHR